MVILVPEFGREQGVMDNLLRILAPQDPPTMKDLGRESFLVDVTRDAHGKLSEVYRVVQYAHGACRSTQGVHGDIRQD